MWPTSKQISRLLDSEIYSVELLYILLELDEEIYLSDLLKNTTIHRRTIEYMMQEKSNLVERGCKYDKNNCTRGAPKVITLKRTEEGTKLLNDIFLDDPHE